jgi:uncharacterized membrane protein
MYTKRIAIVLVAALAAVLITSATLATNDDAEAKKKQKIEQKNEKCNGSCSNKKSQVDGNGNRVSISVS